MPCEYFQSHIVEHASETNSSMGAIYMRIFSVMTDVKEAIDPNWFAGSRLSLTKHTRRDWRASLSQLKEQSDEN